MMNDYKIKNILESLKEEVENGKVSLREAAVELHKAGWTNFIDETLFADVTTPCKCISLLYSVVHYSHELVERKIVGQTITPVILNLDSELRIERMVCI